MNEDNPTSTLNVKIHTEFEIRLTATPSTGYSWHIENLPSQLQLIKEEFESKQPQSAAVTRIAGAASTQVFHLLATNPGNYILKFELKRPWVATSVQKCIFEIEAAS